MKRFSLWNGGNGEMIADPKGKYVLVEDVRELMAEVIEELKKLHEQMKTPGS